MPARPMREVKDGGKGCDGRKFNKELENSYKNSKLWDNLKKEKK